MPHDYLVANFCRACNLSFPKHVHYCDDCGKRVASTPRTAEARRAMRARRTNIATANQKPSGRGSLLPAVMRGDIVDLVQLERVYRRLN